MICARLVDIFFLVWIVNLNYMDTSTISKALK